MLCVYWRGLPAGVTALEVSIVRQFEGIPTMGMKDFLSVSSPIPNPKSIEYVMDVNRNRILHAHSSEVGERLKSLLFKNT